jgi:hypothetical protein
VRVQVYLAGRVEAINRGETHRPRYPSRPRPTAAHRLLHGLTWAIYRQACDARCLDDLSRELSYRSVIPAGPPYDGSVHRTPLAKQSSNTEAASARCRHSDGH